MLTPEEKDHIVQEELYRNEVRNNLADLKKDKKNRLDNFIKGGAFLISLLSIGLAFYSLKTVSDERFNAMNAKMYEKNISSCEEVCSAGEMLMNSLLRAAAAKDDSTEASKYIILANSEQPAFTSALYKSLPYVADSVALKTIELHTCLLDFLDALSQKQNDSLVCSNFVENAPIYYGAMAKTMRNYLGTDAMSTVNIQKFTKVNK